MASKPNFEIKRSGSTVTISTDATILGSKLNEMKLHDNDALTLTFKMELDVNELAKIIGRDDPTKPGWAGRIAEAVATDGLKTAIKAVVVGVAKHLF
jgi:hypothetical protein